MDIMAIFGTQFLLSLLVFGLIARWYVSPWLADKSVHGALAILLLPHAFRHVGLLFVVPAFVDPRLDTSFANMTAYGDLASAVLAILSLLLLRAGWSVAVPVVWIFNLVGTVDLVNALRQADNVPALGVAWFIPTFVVPVLLVTHFMVFARLIRQPAPVPRAVRA